MLNDLLSLVFQSIEFLWPLHFVSPWEQSLRIVCGRWLHVVGPGVYFKIPWFVRFHDVNVNDEPLETARKDVTLKDGRLVSFEITAVIRVSDVRLVTVNLGHYLTESKPLITSRVAQELAEMDPERLLPARRTRLNSSVKEWATQELAPYGILVVAARFSTFVLNPKAIRLLGDAGKLME